MRNKLLQDHMFGAHLGHMLVHERELRLRLGQQLPNVTKSKLKCDERNTWEFRT